MIYLAIALEEQRDYAAALPLYEQALAVDRRIKGDLHPDTLTSIYNLADTRVEMEVSEYRYFA